MRCDAGARANAKVGKTRRVGVVLLGKKTEAEGSIRCVRALGDAEAEIALIRQGRGLVMCWLWCAGQ